MALAARVGLIAGAVGATWERHVPTSCHFATVFWLYHEEFSVPPTLDQYLDIGNPTLVINRMLVHGTRLSRPEEGAVNFTPGTVMVFVKNNQSMHSCIATTATQVGGYNQAGWFSTPGLNHRYSAHSNVDIQWIGPRHVQGGVHRCELFLINERTARAYVRQAAQSR